MTIIKGSTQSLLAALPIDDPRRPHAVRINATVDRGTQLVRQLMTFGREQAVALQSLDVTQLLSEMLPMLRVLLGEQIALQLELAPAPWPVRADPVQVERVIMNLVANAKDAVSEVRGSGRAGVVTVRTANVERGAAAEIAGQSLHPGEYVMLAVSDTGAGMSAEVRQHIFEPYFTTKPFGSGTGLGLYSAFGIVEQLGGSIACSTQPGCGTTLTVYLPREKDDAAMARPAPRDAGTRVASPAPGLPAVARQRAATVLVAEDEEHLRELISEALANAGYRVCVAKDAAEALAVATQLATPIDLLVTDLAMPGSSGYALARHLMQARPAIKVLLMSGYYAEDGTDTTGIPGARFLPKPFDLDLLLQHVRESLESRVPLGANLA